MGERKSLCRLYGYFKLDIMDIKNTIEWAHRHNIQNNRKERNAYDWEHDGILNKCLPKFLFRVSPILVTYLQLIDMRLILMFKAIGRIKEFKHISFY